MLGRKLFSSGLALGLAVTVGFPVHADLLKNLKTDGSIEVRSFSIDNETDRNANADDHRGETKTRLMAGGTFDLLDDVHGRVLLRKNNRVYGAAAGASENLNTVQTAIGVDNAYVKIDKLMGHVDLTMGRQFYGDPNDLVIYFGPQNDDLLSVTALDVFRADADLFGGWLDFQGIAGKLADTGVVGANSDTDIWGAKLATGKVIPKGALMLSYYTRRTKGAGATANNTLNVADLAARGDILNTGLNYRAEYIQNFGQNSTIAPPADNDNDGNALFLGLRYGRNVLDNKPFRAMLEYGRGTNNFTAIAAGKRFGKIWGEHSNSGPSSLNGVGGAGLSNLQVFDAGLGISPTSKLGVDLNAYRFIYDAALASGRTSAGTEYDLIISWKHSANVMLEASAASFQVGDALRNTAPTGTAPITRLGADVKIKF